MVIGFVIYQKNKNIIDPKVYKILIEDNKMKVIVCRSCNEDLFSKLWELDIESLNEENNDDYLKQLYKNLSQQKVEIKKFFDCCEKFLIFISKLNFTNLFKGLKPVSFVYTLLYPITIGYAKENFITEQKSSYQGKCVAEFKCNVALTSLYEYGELKYNPDDSLIFFKDIVKDETVYQWYGHPLFKHFSIFIHCIIYPLIEQLDSYLRGRRYSKLLKQFYSLKRPIEVFLNDITPKPI